MVQDAIPRLSHENSLSLGTFLLRRIARDLEAELKLISWRFSSEVGTEFPLIMLFSMFNAISSNSSTSLYRDHHVLCYTPDSDFCCWNAREIHRWKSCNGTPLVLWATKNTAIPSYDTDRFMHIPAEWASEFIIPMIKQVSSVQSHLLSLFHGLVIISNIFQ